MAVYPTLYTAYALMIIFGVFFILSIHIATPSLKDYQQVYPCRLHRKPHVKKGFKPFFRLFEELGCNQMPMVVHTHFAGWKPTSSHVNYLGFFNMHRGDSPCTGRFQLTFRRMAHSLSVIPANDIKESMNGYQNFSSPAVGIEPMTSSTKGQCANH